MENTDMEIDDNTISEKSSEEFKEHSYECSGCGTVIDIDPMLIYTYDEITKITNKDKSSINYWHSKYSYSKEIEPGTWLTFCRRVCEIKYNRQYEDGWEFSAEKKKIEGKK